MSTIARQALERLARNVRLRRRLPPDFGRRPIWVSPDARLRFLKLGRNAFDLELLSIVRRLVRPGDTVLDVGSNVGELALAAAHICGSGGRVLAVEADPFLASLVQFTSLEKANADVNLEVLCAAASGTSGFSRFNLAERGRAANALAASGSTQMGGVRGALLVPTVTVDSIVAAWHVPSLIKIDVEGAEIQVLAGAVKTLGTHRPVVLFEVTLASGEIETLLADLGYRIFDPAAASFDQSLEHCLFNTLAVPAERIGELTERRRGASA